jgi:hypothetical protein
MAEQKPDNGNAAISEAVAEGGAYEVIRNRLIAQSKKLEKQVVQLNEQREEEFGSSSMEVIGRVRVRTENNCIPADIARVGNNLVFGYNVFIGLKKETQVADVFSAYTLKESEGGFEVLPDKEAALLKDPGFVKDFNELYAYYKHAKLIKLHVANQKLLATFQISQNINDIRVFRWNIDPQNNVTYVDDRGERDVELPPSHEFEWTQLTRDDQVSGQYPHYSVQDKVFVETIAGDLTIKVENNTTDGFGVYREEVLEPNQSLDDAEIYYAEVGTLVLLKVLPYKEDVYRHFVFNSRSNKVTRIDAIGLACLELPEDHGIIFPGGVYLQNDETKIFADDVEGLKFSRTIRSPNGEDVLYTFYDQHAGAYALFTYNLIRKELGSPIYGHGHTFFDDGKSVVFRSENSEPTRVHAMQIWQTSFCTDEYASHREASKTHLGKIGNNELVRGISDLRSISRAARVEDVSLALYEDLIKDCQRVIDAYFWLDDEAMQGLGAHVHKIAKTAELVLDEFEKVAAIQEQANRALREAAIEQKNILKQTHIENWNSAEQFVDALFRLRAQRGHLMTIRELRYIDLDKVQSLEDEVVSEQDELSKKTVTFLLREDALSPYINQNSEISGSIAKIETVSDLAPLIARLEKIGEGLDLLTEILGTLKVEDATKRTQILESISEIYGQINQSKAKARLKEKELGAGEAVAEFAAQFTLFSQSITSAVSMADTPEKCDEQLSRLLILLEELEGKFGEHDEFLGDILSKRDELYETFESRKQALLDERQRLAQNLYSAADRILGSITRRTQTFTEQDELNTYFSSDAMVIKVRDIVAKLRELDDSVKADDLEAKLKASLDDAIRSLRDKQDIFEDAGAVIKLGKHRFSVNTQELDLTIISRDDGLYIHLTGTDFFEKIDHPKFEEYRAYWNRNLVSESSDVYRAEFLAALLLQSAEKNEGFSLDDLKKAALADGELIKLVREFATPRYQEGYEKGVHDHDCVLILSHLLPLMDEAELLRYTPSSRALAILFWQNWKNEKQKEVWQSQAQNGAKLVDSFQSNSGLKLVSDEIAKSIQTFTADNSLSYSTQVCLSAAAYLTLELAKQSFEPVCSHYAVELTDGVLDQLEQTNYRSQFTDTLKDLEGSIKEQFALCEAWLEAYIKNKQLHHLQGFIPEAIALILTRDTILRTEKQVDLILTIDGLMGEHSRITDQKLFFSLDEFLQRLTDFIEIEARQFHEFQHIRQEISQLERDKLHLEAFKAKPLTTFVRNKLINESYLPIVGDNLSKQIGTIGENKRSDLMGLLLLISPPGYGKTTLMEYIANRLGLVFMKINCPSLGHGVDSLDPEQAPNATARQELEKLNLGLEMGNNVMLYLDDIQHTNPEFLQKFIALCDATRRIEGVWKGKTKTYDMRGKKFCVIMAGNPYTESGELFKIPDMLANRADIYNLGDVLSGKEDVFELSYIENALTSNPVLSHLVTRNLEDVYKFMRMVNGEEVPATELSHSYSGAETNEIISVLQKMSVVREMILRVNQEYISSAATEDKYRTEPSFKLQGSYRNMNKMAEKVAAVMDDSEIKNLIEDHYTGEAQLLTTGAEHNLLKLAELRGNMTEVQEQRWSAILKDFRRIKSLGGDESDSAMKIANQLASMTENLASIHSVMNQGSQADNPIEQISKQLATLKDEITNKKIDLQVINQPSQVVEKAMVKMAETIETTFMPVVESMNRKIDLDLNIVRKMEKLSASFSEFTESVEPEEKMTKKTTRKTTTKKSRSRPITKKE